MSSTTIRYKARNGDTIEQICTATGLKPEEILALNKSLKQSTSKLVPNKIYLLPRNPSNNSFASVSDILVEWNARRTEARKDEP